MLIAENGFVGNTAIGEVNLRPYQLLLNDLLQRFEDLVFSRARSPARLCSSQQDFCGGPGSNYHFPGI